MDTAVAEWPETTGGFASGTAGLGPLIEAWLHVRSGTAEAEAEARTRFLPPLHEHLRDAGLGHVSQVVDGDAPHRPGGRPFQARSPGELIRIEAML